MLLLLTRSVYCQNIKAIQDSILQEGLKLYKLERVAWLSSNKLMEKPLNMFMFNGYLPYLDGDTVKTIFYNHNSLGTKVKFISKISLSDTLSIGNIIVNKLDRTPTIRELNLIEVRNKISGIIEESSIIKPLPQHVSLNLSIVERDSSYYGYLLPGTARNDLFYFGGDYICKFSKNKKLVYIKPQHKSLIETKKPEGIVGVIKSIHSHIPPFSPFMTATDICQAKLYGKLTIGCTVFKVVSKFFETTYNTETDEFIIKRESITGL